MRSTERGWTSLVLFAAAAVGGCGAFDEHWTEIFVSADVDVLTSAESLSYCVWDESGTIIADTTESGGPTQGLVVRSGCDDDGATFVEGTAPIPGTIVIENPSGANTSALTFFQLRIRRDAGLGRCADPAACPCYDGCPPSSTPAPGTNTCISSVRAARVVLPNEAEPTRYALRFTAASAFMPEELVGEPPPSCP